MADSQSFVPWTWWWGYGATPGSYNGDFKTKAEAIAAVRARIPPNTGAHEILIAEARPAALRYNVFPADTVLADFQVFNESVADEDGMLRDMETTEGMRLELQEALQATFETWCRKYKVGRAFVLEIKSQEVQMLKAPGEV